MFSDLLSKVRNLPQKPGVYMMKDHGGNIIYIGKAKKLKNRVRSYKKSHFADKICDFDYIITDSELEALILECSLIKEHLPKYNILLKDDKGYPYIKVTLNEPYPKIILARKISKDKARYFGPYLSGKTVRETIDLIKKIFLIRDCNKKLPNNLGKGRPCLNYSIKQCTAPCSGLVTEEEYRESFSEICSFLEGKCEGILKKLKDKMQNLSENLEFERAAKIRDKILTIEKIQEKQKIISTNLSNQDVIAYAQNGNDTCYYMLLIRGGKIIGNKYYIIKNNSDFSGFIKQYYSLSNYVPSTIILRQEISDQDLIQEWLRKKSGAAINIIIPKRGGKLAIAKMAEDNALEMFQSYDIRQRKNMEILNEFKELINLNNIPKRIEAYDISNISGDSNVGVCVVYQDAMPSKNDYRKFNIKTVKRADDYESMREILQRRMKNNEHLPDLILIDGGKGHVNAVKGITEIPVFGMVKDDKHRTRGLTTDKEEIAIKHDSRVFKFLTNVQDEVHRFAIDFHRKKHLKKNMKSELDNIMGVGKAKKESLLKHFKSIKAIKAASIEELILAPKIDKRTAENIYNYFHG